jgi:TDG/mug DNA glycosylase family protein
MRKIAFPPIADSNSRILLLGTMPGEESLRKQEYYGHKSNQFWKILFTLFNQPFSTDYIERAALLIENKIALWDVLSSCEGQGSADTNIKEEQPNDFRLFFSTYPHITHIFFTSKKAEAFYKKYVGFDNDKIYLTLPSPSPANAGMPMVKKLEQWKIVFSVLKS